MSEPINLATAVLEAVKEVVSLGRLWIESGDKRRLRNGVDIADRVFKRYRQVHPEGDKTILKWIDEFYDRIV